MNYTLATRFLLILNLLIACTNVGIAQVTPLSNPTSGNCFTPNLHLSTKGEIWMSWQQKKPGNQHLLWCSKFTNGNWTNPQLIAKERHTGINKNKKQKKGTWFVNWADFPAITTFGKNSLAANFLQKSAASTYAYDVMLTTSNNGGKTWKKAKVAHRDGTATEHGFVSLAPASNNRFLAIWLDGRETAKTSTDTKKHDDHHHGASDKVMTLRAAFFDAQGKVSQPTLLDHRVCDCCQTSLAKTSTGFVAVYRNRSKDEIRDIGVVTYQNGQWSKPQILHNDGWKINGCPVNGPSISAIQDKVAVAWYSYANNKAQIKVAFSKNGGKSFGTPIRVDEGNPLGRVAIAALPNGKAIVVWLEMTKTVTLIKLRQVSPNGQLGAIHAISKTSQSRASGFPKIIVKDKQAFIVWTQVKDLPQKKSNAKRKRPTKKQIKTVVWEIR